ncbi:MAG: fused MFS/spermidine synthase [Chloroflexi bacterium]|nr:fused MFS/spermidine synthase [Chloroflexota bacterium]
MSSRLLQITVFCAGFASLGVELAASRLLAPFFGASLLVWANLIGVILIYLSVGYWLGGRWADRDPNPRTLLLILAGAGLAVGVLPFAAAPLLELAIPALAQFNAELGLVSFLGVVILFAIPVTLLGCVPPFALRLATRDVRTVGATGGGLYALSTIGSILGVYLTVFWMIPTLGTRVTFVVFAAALLAVAFFGLTITRAKILSFLALLFLLLLLGLARVNPTRSIKPLPNAIHETESAYNFIQVIEEDHLRLLTVNEGQAYQSVYYPGMVLLGGYWDLFLLTPYLNTPEPPRSLLVVGLAAGTVTKQFAQVYPDIQMDGIEIDPEIVRMGRELFDMREPNLNVIVDDGRAALRKNDKRYDVIVVDAYRQPYVPFHLATVEYYRELGAHLSARGVIALNAARTPSDARLVNALAQTLQQVFPTVLLLEYPNDTNTVILASPQPVTLDEYRARLDALENPTLREIADIALPYARVFDGGGLVFTDDKSAVENLIHSIILDATIFAGEKNKP